MDSLVLPPRAAIHRPDAAVLRTAIFSCWPELAECDHIAVFGSRAGGVERRDSDWDVFCVSANVHLRAPSLDLVRRTLQQSEQMRWLTSELAHHIAVFGIWLTNEPPWLDSVAPSEIAIIAKAKAITDTVRSLNNRWERLLPIHHTKYLLRLRRDLQRLRVLSNRQAVPPTALLDSEWDSKCTLTDWCELNVRSELTPPAIDGIHLLERHVSKLARMADTLGKK